MSHAVGAIDMALTLGVLTAVGLTMTTRSRKTQVMAFLGLGVVLSLVWFRLSNLDIGLAEAALGSGILSAVLVALVATSFSRRAQLHEQEQQRKAMPRWLSALVAMPCGSVLIVVVASLWWRVEQQMPLWGQNLDPAMADLPVDHGITGVLLSFRAYDTLLESAVLMFAALFAYALLPESALQAAARIPRQTALLSRKFSFGWAFRVFAPVLLLLGLWVLFAGTTEAGGAFQSGAVIAAMLIMLHIAEVRLDHFIRYWLVPLIVGGVGIFVLASALGPLMSQAWFTWPTTGGYAVILSIEISLTAGIAAALFMLYLAVLQSPEDMTSRDDRAALARGATS